MEENIGKIKKFEDMLAWQKAKELVSAIYHISNTGLFAKDFGLRDQIRRASISIMLNIAEGFARRTSREFLKFMVIAYGSVAEVQSALYVALDQKYISQEQFEKLYKITNETPKIIMGFSNYLRRNL